MRHWILKKVRYLEPLKSCCPGTVSGRYKNTVKIKEPNKTCSLYSTNSILRQKAVKQHWASKIKFPSSKILVIIRWHYSANNFSVVTFLLLFNCDILQVSWNWATQFRNEVSREVTVLPKNLEGGLIMLTVRFLPLSHVALCHSYRDQISLISTMLLCANSISSWRERAKWRYEVHSLCAQAVWEESN